MASTFWERAGSFGEGAAEPLDLNNLQDAMLLVGRDAITRTDAKDWLELTPEQGVSFEYLLDQQPSSAQDRIRFVLDVRAFINGARARRASLNSVEDLKFQVVGEGAP